MILTFASRIQRALATVVAGLALVIGIFLGGSRFGKRSTLRKMEKVDEKRAADLRRRAARKLRDSGRGYRD